jgi:hypothetical protein
MTAGDDRLAELKERIAEEHLGDRYLARRLHGGNDAQLREDAERFRLEARMTGSGRPSLEAALFVARRNQQQMLRRVLAPTLDPRSPDSPLEHRQ